LNRLIVFQRLNRFSILRVLVADRLQCY
jgi:hypothetical protein